ncbi:MAG: hypothetical protein J6W15_07820, partial [Clostridia bacterium]|nr:hypothetical protein [Clostridia bacterium]
YGIREKYLAIQASEFVTQAYLLLKELLIYGKSGSGIIAGKLEIGVNPRDLKQVLWVIFAVNG